MNMNLLNTISRFAANAAARGFDVPLPIFRKTIGHHSIQISAGDGGWPREETWAVSLHLNSSGTYNRWSAANFPTVDAAIDHAEAIIAAIAAVEA